MDEQIKKRFEQLPKSIQNVIINSGWEKKVRQIVSSHNLRVDQGGSIETETMFVMFGFTSSEEFLQNIIENAELTPEVATAVAEEIDSEIFAPMRDALISETEESEEDLHPDREAILKEIEEVDTPVTTTEIATTPAGQIEAPHSTNSAEVSTNNTPNNPIAEKLQSSTATQTKTVSLDPYREPVE